MIIKKAVALGTALTLCILMSACSKVEKKPIEVQTTPAQTQSVTNASEVKADDENTDDSLSVILCEIKDSYYPGTAGCSLTAIKYAGELLDWYSASGALTENISTETEWFVYEMDADAKSEYAEKMDDIYFASCSLLGDNAEDMMESAGYEAQTFPWSEAAVVELFTALYAGMSLQLPQI